MILSKLAIHSLTPSRMTLRGTPDRRTFFMWLKEHWSIITPLPSSCSLALSIPSRGSVSTDSRVLLAATALRLILVYSNYGGNSWYLALLGPPSPSSNYTEEYAHLRSGNAFKNVRGRKVLQILLRKRKVKKKTHTHWRGRNIHKQKKRLRRQKGANSNTFHKNVQRIALSNDKHTNKTKKKVTKKKQSENVCMEQQLKCRQHHLHHSGSLVLTWPLRQK